MALDATKVRVAVTGVVSVAPTGTTLPTVATSSLDAAFDDVGYISEDGIVQHIASDITDLKAWQNGDIVRKIQTSHDVSFDLTMIEFNPVSLEAFFGNYTDLADGASFQVTGDQLTHQCFCFDVVDAAVRLRLVLPDGQITERGDVSLVNGEPIGLPITVTAFPDVTGVKVYGYIDENIDTSA